jgi:hypothetical protein
MTEITEQYGRNWTEHVGCMSSDRITEKILMSQSRKKMFQKTTETVEGHYFVMTMMMKYDQMYNVGTSHPCTYFGYN